MLVVVVAISTPIEVLAAENKTAAVVFNASECDADGNFLLSMTIYNAKFNTFQFVIRYDQTTVTPVDKTGAPTGSFSAFSKKKTGTDWLSTVGTSIDTQKGLIDFTGYVTPGDGLSTDGLEQIQGYANVGDTGISVFDFHFRKTGSTDTVIEIASQSTSKVYSGFLPEGAALIDAGEKLPLDVKFDLPKSVGTGGTYRPSAPKADSAMTKEERLKGTIALQIGNYGAAAEGTLFQIDPDNPDVHPYIDGNGRTMVPVRFVAEQLGASVNWNSTVQQVTIKSGDRTILMTIGSRNYTVNGVANSMDTAPVIKAGWNRTMVPIRFVSEALGRAVEWDPQNRLVIITEKSTPWQSDRDAEKQAVQSILFVISDLVRDFIY